MTPHDCASASRRLQGLPDHVEDPGAVAHVVALLRRSGPAEGAAPEGFAGVTAAGPHCTRRLSHSAGGGR